MLEVSPTKQKMILLILVGVVLLVMVMLGVMFLKTTKTKQDNKNKQTEQIKKDAVTKNSKNVNQQNLPTKTTKKIMKLVSGRVYGLTIRPGTNQAMFYQDNKFLTVDPFDGKLRSVGGYPFVKIKHLLWNNDLTRALVEDSNNFYVYYSAGNNIAKFELKIDWAIWDKKGEKIIYKYYDNKLHQRQIGVADFNGENEKVIIEHLPYRQVEMVFQPGNEDRMCYWAKPDARVKGIMFCNDLSGKNPKEYGGQYGQDYLWSPNGEKILTSFSKGEAGNQLVMGIMNKNGGELKGLMFSSTIRKCVWSKDNINVYCAMLTGAPTDIMLPNAWDKQIFSSLDTFWKINTETGQKERLFESSELPVPVDAGNLMFDPEENFLYFIDRRQNSLWRIKL